MQQPELVGINSGSQLVPDIKRYASACGSEPDRVNYSESEGSEAMKGSSFVSLKILDSRSDDRLSAKPTYSLSLLGSNATGTRLRILEKT